MSKGIKKRKSQDVASMSKKHLKANKKLVSKRRRRKSWD